MRWTLAALAVLAAGAEAGISEAMEGSIRRDSALDQRLRDLAVRQLQSASLSLRQSNNLTLIQTAGAPMNLSAWNDEVTAACTSALSGLPSSSNPSGTCICYNIIKLDNTTGVFGADLKLYQLSEPRDAFAGIPPENIQVSLSYKDATATPVSNQTVAQTFMVKRQEIIDPNVHNNLTLLQSYYLMGQINQQALAKAKNASDFEAIVTPILTLTANNPQGQTISTNVSSNEAAFVAGVFANMQFLSQTAQAQLAVNQALLGLANGTVPFVLPGVQVLIAPIGLIITGFWTLVFLGAVGLGTVERIQYRERYKRAVARSTGKGTAARF